MVSDGSWGKEDINKIKQQDIDLITKLITLQQKHSTNLLSLDPYILSMIKSYIRKKRQIVINLMGLSRLDKQAYDLIIEAGLKPTMDVDLDDIGRCNLMSHKIFEILPFAANVIIKTHCTKSTCGTEWDGAYAINMYHFLDIICKSKVWKVIIVEQMMANYKTYQRCWIRDLWNETSEQKQMIEAYRKKRFKLSYEHKVQQCDHAGKVSTDRFRIERLDK